jgi:hypothetical protein
MVGTSVYNVLHLFLNSPVFHCFCNNICCRKTQLSSTINHLFHFFKYTFRKSLFHCSECKYFWIQKVASTFITFRSFSLFFLSFPRYSDTSKNTEKPKKTKKVLRKKKLFFRNIHRSAYLVWYEG